MKIDRFREKLGMVWRRIGDGLLAAGCLLLALALYLQTLAPSVATLFDDSLEFPLVVERLAIAHPTGYPLYVLLGKMLSLGPWQNVAWAVNLLSALAGALTVALAYLVARRLTRRRWPALVAALALAVSPVFWSQAIVAEVYTLHSAFVAGLLWLALRWAQEPLWPVEPFSLLWAAPRRRGPLFLPREGPGQRLPPPVRKAARRIHTLYRRTFPAVPAKRRLRISPWLYALVAVLGLAQAHHRTALLLVPALLVFALLVEPRVFRRAALLGPEQPDRPRWRQLAGRPVVLLLLSLILPLCLYLYLPLRAEVGSLDGSYAQIGFWPWVTGSAYGTFLGDNPLARDLDAAFYLDLFLAQFGPVGLALAAVGLVGFFRAPAHGGPQSTATAAGLWSRRSRLAALALTGLATLTYVAFALVYRVPDVEVFFIPAFLLVAVWIGAGLDYGLDLLRIRGPSLARRRLLAAGSLLLAALAVGQPLLLLARNYPDLDLSRQWLVHDYGRYVLAQELPYGQSTVVGLGGEMTLLEYVQATSHLRTDVETVRADDEAARRAAVAEALARGRTVFLTRPLPGLAEEYALGAVLGLIELPDTLASLVRVGTPSAQAPALPRSVQKEIVPGLELLGYGVHEHHEHWQAWARLRLWWAAADGAAADRVEAFKVSARLVNAEGVTVAATDAEPVSGAYPAPAWRPGEVVADAYEIPLPAGLLPGEYRPRVIVYDPASGAERGRADLAAVYLRGNRARPPQRALEAAVGETAYARFGNVELLGYRPPDPGTVYAPGDRLPLTLLWQGRGEPRGELEVSFWLAAIEDYELGAEAVGGRFPADRWAGDQAVAQWPGLTLPADVPAGDYRLKMRVERDGVPVAWSRGWLPGGSDLDLGEVRVER